MNFLVGLLSCLFIYLFVYLCMFFLFVRSFVCLIVLILYNIIREVATEIIGLIKSINTICKTLQTRCRIPFQELHRISSKRVTQCSSYFYALCSRLPVACHNPDTRFALQTHV